MIAPRLAALDQVLQPGCVSFTWASPNVDEFCDSLQKAIEQFDLLVVRVCELITYRIDAVLHDISNTPLVEINDEEAIFVEDFIQRTESLCEQGGRSIQIKSKNVEEATEELIDLIYPDYKANIDALYAVDKAIAEKQPSTLGDDSLKRNSITQRGNSGNNNSSKLQSTPVVQNLKKRREAYLVMQDAVNEVYSYFNHKNIEAIIKLIKHTLEKLRRRIANAIQSMAYNKSDGYEVKKREVSVFKAYAVLAIPNITMQPSLDDIQQVVNRAVQMVILTTKQINQWQDLKKKAKKVNII